MDPKYRPSKRYEEAVCLGITQGLGGLIGDSIQAAVEKLPYQQNVTAYAEFDFQMLESITSLCTVTSMCFNGILKARQVYQQM